MNKRSERKNRISNWAIFSDVGEIFTAARRKFKACSCESNESFDPGIKGSDAATALKPEVADEIERILEVGGAPFFNLSNVLMGFTKQRFGISAQDFNDLSDIEYKKAVQRCETCKNASHCWHALRTGQQAIKWRDFCPNTVTFESLIEH